jgi:hypothetical protein
VVASFPSGDGIDMASRCRGIGMGGRPESGAIAGVIGSSLDMLIERAGSGTVVGVRLACPRTELASPLTRSDASSKIRRSDIPPGMNRLPRSISFIPQFHFDPFSWYRPA